MMQSAPNEGTSMLDYEYEMRTHFYQGVAEAIKVLHILISNQWNAQKSILMNWCQQSSY